MINPRILFRGDPTEAVKWTGLAQDFGRSTFTAGIISKVWQVSAGVTIRVRNAITAKICKVWINAEIGDAHGYQFYTTSPAVEWAYWQDADKDFCPGGSMIFAPTPQFPKDPLGYQTSFTREELDAIKLYAYPTHTLVEDPPRKLLNGEMRNECSYTPMPSTVGGVNGLNQIMNQVGTFKATNAWQINGIPEHACYHMTPKYVLTVNGSESEPVFTGHYQGDFSILTAWQQPGGHIFSYGLYSLVYYPTITDVGYDMAPQKITRNMSGQMPDGDWPERACITRAGTTAFGYRWYIILHTANDDWLCWPYLSGSNLDPSIATDAPAGWKNQAYKANVPAEYAKKARPSFPSWVYSTGDERRNHTEPLSPKPEPRVTFHFNSTGTKAIGAMVERTPIDEVGESTVKRINFMNPDSGIAFSRTNWYADATIWRHAITYNLHAPIEEDTGILANIDASKILYGVSKEPGPQLYQYDRTGIVELGFTIEVTGPDLGDFTFSIDTLRSESPDVLDIYDVGALVDVGYAKPMLSDSLVNNVSVPGLNRDAEVRNPPLVDELVTAFITLYQHEEQRKYDLAAYCCANDSPSKSKVAFYKGDDYKSASNPILELPLSQRHGSGYSGNAFLDPDTGEPISIPSDPHEPVDYKNNTYLEEHRPHTDTRPPRYLYEAKLSYLNISTLSFYYIARVTKLTTDDDDYVLSIIPPDENIFIGRELLLHKEFNEQAELCNVYVFGRIAHESVVGMTDMGDYLRGWIDKAPANFPEDGEEKILTTYKNNTDFDLYFSEPGITVSPHIWWLNGACGFCIYKTIENSIYNRTYDHVYSGPFPYKSVGVTLFDDGGSPLATPTPGEIITEDDAKELLRYAVTKWGEFVSGNITSTISLPFDTRGPTIQTIGGIDCSGTDMSDAGPNPGWYPVYFDVGYFFETSYANKPTYTLTTYTCINNILYSSSEVIDYNTNPNATTLYNYCKDSKNPFSLAKEDFDLDKFVDQAAWLMMKLCNIITEIASDRIGDPYIGPEYHQNIYKQAVFLLSRKFTYNFYDDNGFDLFGEIDLNGDFNYIKKYDWAVHLYNYYRTRRFTACINTDEYGAILTTPEGHYSYYYRDHYAINKKYAVNAAYFIKGIRHEDVRYAASSPGNRSVETRVGNDEFVYGGSFDWKLVDGVGWYFGLVKTSHLDLYNMAFSETWRNDMRSQGRNTPYALPTELPIIVNYAESDYKPSFTVIMSTSPSLGEPLYAPHKGDDNYYYTLQLEVSFPNNTYLSSPWGFPGYYYFDSRPYKKHIRLSPLFF